jgi:hypothetical protein
MSAPFPRSSEWIIALLMQMISLLSILINDSQPDIYNLSALFGKFKRLKCSDCRLFFNESSS